jgi:hypothetical protein
MTLFRHADARYPFLWESERQPPGRWHGEGEGPVHYLADTPDGAWAELLRHEEIRDPRELATIRRALWAVEVPEERPARPRLPVGLLTGDADSYGRCRKEARRLRAAGARVLVATSAALQPRAARGWKVQGGMHPARARDGKVYVLFGPRPDLVGWAAVMDGHPPENLLPRVRHFGAAAAPASGARAADAPSRQVD